LFISVVGLSLFSGRSAGRSDGETRAEISGALFYSISRVAAGSNWRCCSPRD
jgi:hypothetical protein